MFHLNSWIRENRADIRKQSLWKYLSSFTLPEMYQAADIADFLKERETVRPTRGFTYTQRWFRDSALIRFPSVVYYCIYKKHGTLSDPTGEIDVWLNSINIHTHKILKQLKDGQRIHKAMIQYNVNLEVAWLLSYDTHGPVQKESARTYDVFLEILHSY